MSKTVATLNINLSYHFNFGIFLVSFSSLLLEYTLIRVLSISLWYHFAFMLISIALLGIGSSGVVLATSNKLKRTKLSFFLPTVTLCFSVSILLSFFIINKIPFDPFSLLVDSNQLIYLPLYYLTLVLPFFFSGLIIGKLFTKFNKDISKLYFFDLLGAGLSCLIFILMIPSLGGSGLIILSSLISLIAFFLFNLKSANYKQTYNIIGFIALLFIILFISKPEEYLPINVSVNKPYENYLKENPDLKIATEWNTISRVDIIKDEDKPVDNYPLYIAIIDAGNSTTNIPNVPLNHEKLIPPFDASNLAMVLKNDTSSVYIVGSGGGGEILSALSHNARSVTAVEINGLLNDLITKKYASYWTAGIVNDPRVKIITDDARGYLRSKRIKYDVLISAHTVSSSATASGAMNLIENYIMTQEAIEDYLHHLKVDGVLYITRPEAQLPRLITTLKIAYLNIAKLDAKNNFFVFRRPPSEFEGNQSYLSGIVFKKDGFDKYDVIKLKNEASKLGLDVEYDPDSKQEYKYKILIETDDIYNEINKYHLNIKPATDDKPYFEHQTKFTDINLADIKQSFSQTDKAIVSLSQKPVAESTLLVIFIQVIIISFLLLFIPIKIKFRKSPEFKQQKKLYHIIYFACLGLGYIMIEICLIQKFTLFLGQPTYTMLSVISTLLVFSGIGSLLSDKIIKLFRNRVEIIFVLIILLSISIGIFNQYLFDLFFRADILWRILITIIAIAPLGFFMGMPFPNGIKLINQNKEFLVVYSWAVNCFFSVIGSISVMIFSMSYGFRMVFMLSAIIYLIAMFVRKKFELPFTI